MGDGGWIGVDLDGTLAEYHGWRGEVHVGPPVPAMLERVKGWLAEGIEVRIFTARVGPTAQKAEEARGVIATWCLEHVGEILLVTATKDFGMYELWDDRAITVEANTGRVIMHPRGQEPTP